VQDEAAVTGAEVDCDRAMAAGNLVDSSTIDPVFFLALHDVHGGQRSRPTDSGPAGALDHPNPRISRSTASI
jgi:hypothetical protein